MTTDLDPGASFNSMWTELRGVPFSQDWVMAGDINTRYLHTGSDDKPGLILLHGFIGHAEAFIRNLAVHGEHDPRVALARGEAARDQLTASGYRVEWHTPLHPIRVLEATGERTSTVDWPPFVPVPGTRVC